MKESIHHAFYISCMAVTLLGCQPKQQPSSQIPVLDVRTIIGKESSIELKKEIAHVEYIPLETNDSCLISNLLNLQLSDEYLFMYNGKTRQVLQFDRKGKFVRPIGRPGGGPGEYGLVSELAIETDLRELSIFQYGDSRLIYSFDGVFLRKDSVIPSQAAGMYKLPNGDFALKGLIMSPIQNAPWAGALMTKEGALKASKNLYPSTLKEDVCFMKEICFSPSSKNVLLFTSCNDTVFDISSNGITPAYILQRQNESDYYANIADISRLGDPAIENEQTIGVYDFFETGNSFFVRLYKGENIYLLHYDKSTGELKSQRAHDDYIASSGMIPGNNVIGIKNDFDGGIPFWPEFHCNENSRAQVVSASLISALREKGHLIGGPSALEIGEDDNPVIIIYQFKHHI
ncbi:MAG: 6-bladed beta-propeller [Bacteroidales bacterium]